MDGLCFIHAVSNLVILSLHFGVCGSCASAMRNFGVCLSNLHFLLWRRPSISAGVLALRPGVGPASAFTWRSYHQPCGPYGSMSLCSLLQFSET